ncbi:protein timeless homolog [Portunus trituberculatus]|uniref:protein timeless homolog n=1 Tax=Portunus trituberculatus TaxID=210409 RepID=UPI001E1CE634|nr:protein timeless homolog [Portunus trituberculatus]WQB60165.1 timeout-protein [Portunus trituberculatus]
MAEGLVHAELLAACSSLGHNDGLHYHREADCLETTKDLLRYLRRDDESHQVRRALGDSRVLQTDLLPLLQEHSQDEELLQLVVRLLVDLTNPALLLFREELPEEMVTRKQFLQLVRHQQGYKEAFTNQQAWEALAGRLRAILEIPKEEREEDERLLLERILVLTRNVLWAPASPEEGRTDNDSSLHDQVLWAMHLSGMAELLLYMTTSVAEHDFSLHLLEIISLMLREQDACWLATSNLRRSAQEKEEDDRRLQELRRLEALQREARRRASTSSRHSRFGGTYVVRQMKGVSDQDLIVHRPLANVSELSFDRHKKARKHNKNRLPMRECSTQRRSILAVSLFLQEFCVEFLAGAYNTVMATVKDSLDRARAQEHDETYYLWAIRFFLEFNRHHNFRVELVTETLAIETFHFIQTQIENYFERMTAEKKKVAVWSRRMHRALRAYQELLATLAHMDALPSQEVRESSRVLKSRLFYMVEYREMMLLLLQNYDPIKMSLGYLRDAVEATHIFLKLLEGMCRKGKHVLVQGKTKISNKKKPKAAAATPGTMAFTPTQLQELWDEVSGEVAAVVQGSPDTLPDMVPFDALSEESEEVQKETAMRRISHHLRGKELPQAVSLMRAAREVWPEGDIFGPQESDSTQDFLTLQEIFMANLSSPQEAPVQELDELEEYEEEEEEVEERMAVMSEQEFDFVGFVRRFANTKVVKAYSSLLHHYPTNTNHTNHCILKLFHRLAWDCKLPAIFFQASLFLVFLRAMEDPLRASSESPREIARFGKYIVRQLYKVAQTNPKVFVELLFWKTNREALEIECGYGEMESGKEAAKMAWGEEEEEELRRLHSEVEEIPAEARGEKDTVDLIMERLISTNRTRRSVIKKLKELGLIRSTNDLKKKTPKISAPRTWTEEEEEELRRLFEENKEAMDIVGRIMDNMSLRRPKHRVMEKILELGLVEDRKQLWKKRSKKTTARPKRKTGQDFLSANQATDDEVDEGSESEATLASDEEGDNTTGSQRASRNPAPPPAPVATPALISKALSVVLGAGRSEAVEWLSRILQDVADDREEDGDFEPVPVLAITQACTDAMEDEEFHKLLRLVGLQPPMKHQEMFWRVPSRLSVEGLRKRAQYLTQGASGELQDLENPDEPLEPVQPEPVNVKPQKAKKPKKAKSKQKASKMTRSGSEDKENQFKGTSVNMVSDDGPLSQRQSGENESGEDDVPLSSLTGRSSPSSSRPHSRASKRMLSDDSDGELSQRKTVKEKKKKKKRLVLDSDSEEEKDDGERVEEEKDDGDRTEEEDDGEKEVVSQTSKKQRIRAIIDSDDE